MELEGSSRIVGIGAYLPEQRILSESLMDEIDSHRFGTPTNFISNTIGIRERRVAGNNISRSDMATMASESALDDACVSAEEVDLIIYCGIEGDWQEPASSHFVQTSLGANRATCLDITNACHGFMNGLAIADSFIASKSVKTVLVCTGEKPSVVMFEMMEHLKKTTDKEDFKRWLGFLTVGDAGGAMVLQVSSDESGWKRFRFCSEGENTDLCYYRYNGQGIEGQMMMKGVSTKMLQIHQDMIEQTYRDLYWTPDNVDKLYCHQVGARPHKLMAKLADMSLGDAPITYENYGNLTSATIPVNMTLNRPNRGDKLLFLVAGSGFSVCQAGMVF